MLATQTKQKIFSYIVNINENLKKTDKKKCCFKCVNRATYPDQTQTIMLEKLVG